MQLRSALDRWAARQDATTLDTLGGLGAWLSATCIVVLIVAVGAWIPATAAKIQLDASAALLTFGVAASGGIGLALLRDKGRPYSKAEKITTLWTSTALQLFCAVLIARSSLLGSILFFPTLLFAGASHGFMHRTTLSEPFPALGTLAATVTGIALCTSQEQALLLGLSGSLAVATSLYLGTLATRADDNRRRRGRMRAAILAQELRDRAARIGQLSQSLVDVMSNAHDMGNTLYAFELVGQSLAMLKASSTGAQREQVDRIERQLREGTTRLHGMIGDIKARRGAIDAVDAGSDDSAEVGAVVAAVAETVAFRASQASIASEIEEDTRVDVAGGSASLYRILENLVINAVQGNGVRGASNVVVRSVAVGELQRIIVEDDGPGFTASQLERPITAFDTTKKDGTGLGLYTTDRLIHASGGALRRTNRAEGGARVTVTLRRSEK